MTVFPEGLYVMFKLQSMFAMFSFAVSCLYFWLLLTGVILDSSQLMCDECGKEFIESWLHNTFLHEVCDKCRSVINTIE